MSAARALMREEEEKKKKMMDEYKKSLEVAAPEPEPEPEPEEEDEDEAAKQRNAMAEWIKMETTTLRPGDATHFPSRGQTVRIHYEGRLADGTLFDSSWERQMPILFKLGQNQVIRGLDSGVAKMSRGQQCQFVMNPGMAYGTEGYHPIIPPRAVLTYKVELIAFS